jgi:hypothetical protein
MGLYSTQTVFLEHNATYISNSVHTFNLSKEEVRRRIREDALEKAAREKPLLDIKARTKLSAQGKSPYFSGKR